MSKFPFKEPNPKLFQSMKNLGFHSISWVLPSNGFKRFLMALYGYIVVVLTI